MGFVRALKQNARIGGNLRGFVRAAGDRKRSDGLETCAGRRGRYAAMSRSSRKQEKLQEKSGKLRCRCGFARTQAFQHGCVDMFFKRDTETEPHIHKNTHTGCLYHSFSQALSVSGLQKSFGPWPSSRTRACLYSASARSTVLSPGSFRSR